MKKILVTGGLGFIGSHTVVELQNEGFEVVIIDDLSNSSESVLDGIIGITNKKPIFEKLDLKDKSSVENFFATHNDISGVIHFAASKAVGESVKNPLLYYENNLNTLIYMLQEVLGLEESNFIFSSSCTVYGQADTMPITENAPVKPAESPYGNTKQIGEEIIVDTCKVNSNLNAIALRYFNPIGAHPSVKIGELPIGVPQNLVPFITQTAAGLRDSLSIFGNDYPTPDGTCIRDYIHVVDLAKAHVLALQRLLKNKNDSNFETFNLGTGVGSSVLEVVNAFERVSNQSLNYKFAPKREGDVISAYAHTEKANTILGWKANLTLDDAIDSAWKWEQKSEIYKPYIMMRVVQLIILLLSISVTGQDIYLHCGKVIDTKNGKVLTKRTIVVSDDKIVSIDDGFNEGKTSKDLIVDLKSKTVMPGLIDMHVHIEGETGPNKYLETFTKNDANVAYTAAEIANRTLLSGFTTVRDLGGSGVNVALRDAIASGKVPGPRIFTAEKAIATTGGHADPTNGMRKELMGDPGPAEGVINGVEDARKAVRQRYKNGADLIKITATGGVLSVAKNGANAQFTQEEVNEIVKTAKEYGMVVAAHAHGKEGMKRAVLAGVQTIEHGSFMDKEVASLMKQYNCYMVPTLSAGRYVEEKAKIPNYYPAVIIPKITSTMAVLDETIKMVISESVPIAFGTDAGVFPHGENAKEFRFMVEAGWSTMFSLQSATITNAMLLDMEGKLGQLKEGFIADIIAVDEDPTLHISTMESVIFVMKDGVIYKSEL